MSEVAAAACAASRSAARISSAELKRREALRAIARASTSETSRGTCAAVSLAGRKGSGSPLSTEVARVKASGGVMPVSRW